MLFMLAQSVIPEIIPRLHYQNAPREAHSLHSVGQDAIRGIVQWARSE